MSWVGVGTWPVPDASAQGCRSELFAQLRRVRLSTRGRQPIYKREATHLQEGGNLVRFPDPD